MKEMSERSEADCVSNDLVERVGRELARTGYAFAGIDLTDPYTADADYWNSQARAAIAVLRPALRAEALEEAAKVADRVSDEAAVRCRDALLDDEREIAERCADESAGSKSAAAAIRALVKQSTTEEGRA